MKIRDLLKRRGKILTRLTLPVSAFAVLLGFVATSFYSTSPVPDGVVVQADPTSKIALKLNFDISATNLSRLLAPGITLTNALAILGLLISLSLGSAVAGQVVLRRSRLKSK